MKVGLAPGRVSAAGFTIVETMIVLAVTGALFVIIASTLSGRQNEAQFVHAVQSVQSQMQQVINQVSAGFFPTVDLNCTAGAGTLTFNTGGNQGTNAECVFLGSVVQFHVHGSDPEEYRIYTIAGKRGPSIGATSPFQNVTPAVVGIAATVDYTTYSTAKPLEYGLTTAWVRSDNNSACVAAGCSLGAIGFLMEPGGFASSAGYNSGAQPVDLVPIPGTSINQTITQTVGFINNVTGLNDPNLSNDAPVNPSGGAQICFVSAGTNQSALMTIGSLGRQLIVKVDVKSNSTCS